jgi:hypothetical protein
VKERKAGSHHALLLYQRSMNRIWKITLLLGVVLAFAWGWGFWETKTISIVSVNTLMLAAASLAFMLTVFFFLGRYMAYVQPSQKYLKLVTPFLRMKISYRRMRSVRPMLVQQIFPKAESSRSLRNALEPFYGKTAVVIELQGFPISESRLRMFLPSAMFSRQFTGLVLIVPDWMLLSTEIDSYRGTLSRSIKDRSWSDSRKGW